MFIVAAVQGLKIGDLTQTPRLTFDSDAPGEDMIIDESENPDEPHLDRDDERSLVRDSTAGFAGKAFALIIPPRIIFKSINRLGCQFLPTRVRTVRESSRGGWQI